MPTYVRDNRGGNWWWAHNAIIDFYGPRIGAYSVAIYCALCRYAGREQQTWVSQRLLREQLGLSDNTVRRALHTLRDARLIAIEEQTDERGRSTNVYTLLPVDEAPTSSREVGGVPGEVATIPVAEGSLSTGRALQFMTKTHGKRGSPPRKKDGAEQDLDSTAHVDDSVGAAPIDLWTAVLADLQEQMVPANFTRWLVRTSLLSHAAGAAVVGVPDQISADQLARRFDPLVRRALADACGETVTVEYQVVEG